MQAHAGHSAAKLEESETAEKSAIVAIYDTHEEAEEAVRELQKSGFDMQKLSIVGKDYQTEEEVVGYYTTGDRMKKWGKTGAFWGGLWGLLFGSAFFLIPGIGPLLAAGPLVGVDHRCAGRRGGGWGRERARRGPVQHRDSQRQHHRIRDADQDGQIRCHHPRLA